MRATWLLLLLAVWPRSACAADLSKIDRTIAKEPTYQSKEPRYCLLVLGPEARQRVWLVHDDNQLFVDVNGNGDLTEPGKCIKAQGDAGSALSFRVPILGTDGRSRHDLQADFFKASTFGQDIGGPFAALLTLTWTRDRTFGAWGDEGGMLIFATRPQEAPVVHIDGPLQMGFECHLPFQVKSPGVYELNVGVGTPGLGKGSFAHLKYWKDAIPEGVYPRAVLEFPGKAPDGAPVRVEAVLKQRC
jgi:hypothetical protein